MKNFYFFLLSLCVFSSAHAQIIDIPDANFKAILLAADTNNGIAEDLNGNDIKIDTNNNNEIEISEVLQVYNLYLNNASISSMVGIESFTNLQDLSCEYNQLTSLNVSGLTNLQNFYVDNNYNLTSLNISGLMSLQYLYCSYTGLTSLDASGLPNLENFTCTNNDSLTSLNISGLTSLQHLNCFNNQLTSLNVNGLIDLQSLHCIGNQLNSLELIGLTSLQTLYCSNNQITALNLSSLTSLEILDCASNQLTSLNLSGLTNLQSLNCNQNLISSLNLSDGLSSISNISCDFNQLTSLDLSGLTNLYYLQCAENQITSLDFSSLTNLASLGCNNNQLTSLNLSNLTNLYYLSCNNNQLTSLNVNELTSLVNLSYSNNQINSLSLSNLTNLKTLNCSENEQTSLDLSGLINLLSLDCSFNQYNYLNLSGLSNLETLKCGSNQLTSLDLSDLTNLKHFYCIENQLTSLFIKNGSYELDYDFMYNPNLSYICADEFELDSIQDYLNNLNYTNTILNSYCSFTPGGSFYTIEGNSRLDSNNNGCDVMDSVLPNLNISITDGINNGNFISNASGNYSIPVSAGTHTLTPVLENPSYFTISPANVSVEFPIQTSPFIQNFCITPNGIHPDLEVTILPIDAARPGFDAHYKIIYKNKGNQIQSGTVNLTFNDAVLDLITANPAVSSALVNSLVWDFTDLQPAESLEITFTLNVNSPVETPAVNGGDILDYSVVITSSATDETLSDNTFALNQTVVNSFDPNDKTCLEGATITPEMVGKYVHYMIRFENTGTYPAEDIVVKDMIDTEKFDVSTLVPTNGSHPFVTRITEGNKVEFIFENINLPFEDANNDGYVAFKIKTKPTLVVGNTFSNTASIYFDYNAPIVTDPATTTVAVLGTQDFEFSTYFNLYPNPATSILNIDLKKEITVSTITIYNILGQQVLVIPNAQLTKSVDVSSLTTGNYFMKLNTDKGMATAQFIKK